MPLTLAETPVAPVVDVPATIVQDGRMPNEQREVFERRLLALVRDQLDRWDEWYPEGWEITDFVVTARGHYPPEAGESINPWAGGPYPGWGVAAWTRGSSPTWIVDIELLADALTYVRSRAEENDDDDEDASGA